MYATSTLENFRRINIKTFMPSSTLWLSNILLMSHMFDLPIKEVQYVLNDSVNVGNVITVILQVLWN